MQQRTWLGALVVGVALGSGASISITFGQGLPSAQSPAESYQQTVVPILSKNCISCHSDRVHTAGLSLEALRDPNAALAKPDVWVKVLDKLKAGTMPPRTMPPLSPEDLNAVTSWIERLSSVSPAEAGRHPDEAGRHAGDASTNKDAAAADPGRVTARRLNRAEYNNTIRDLLGVSLRPADEFPMDDSG